MEDAAWPARPSCGASITVIDLKRRVSVMDESTAAHLANGIDLEGEIKAEFVKAASVRELRLANSAPITVRVPRGAMPEYVQHREGATEVGKLSAEAIV